MPNSFRTGLVVNRIGQPQSRRYLGRDLSRRIEGGEAVARAAASPCWLRPLAATAMEYAPL